MSGLVFSLCIFAAFIVVAFLASLGAGKAMKTPPAPPLHSTRMPADTMSEAEYAWRSHRGDDAA